MQVLYINRREFLNHTSSLGPARCFLLTCYADDFGTTNNGVAADIPENTNYGDFMSSSNCDNWTHGSAHGAQDEHEAAFRPVESSPWSCEDVSTDVGRVRSRLLGIPFLACNAEVSPACCTDAMKSYPLVVRSSVSSGLLLTCTKGMLSRSLFESSILRLGHDGWKTGGRLED